jgi:hypothetical protein
LKSTLFSALALVALAFTGSFLSLWKLPYQEHPYTYRDLSEKIGKHFLNDELREAREEHRKESETVFSVNE